MLDFQQKRKIRSVAYNKVTLIILFLLILVMAHSTWTIYKKEQTSKEMKDISLQNVEELRARSEDLKSKVDTLKTNTGIEEEIRSKFNVTKDNESMVVVVDDETGTTSTTTLRVSFWQKILNFFLK